MAVEKMEISIKLVEDRATMASILVRNGYAVAPRKRKKSPSGKQIDYFLEIWKTEDAVDG